MNDYFFGFLPFLTSVFLSFVFLYAFNLRQNSRLSIEGRSYSRRLAFTFFEPLFAILLVTLNSLVLLFSVFHTPTYEPVIVHSSFDGSTPPAIAIPKSEAGVERIPALKIFYKMDVNSPKSMEAGDTVNIEAEVRITHYVIGWSVQKFGEDNSEFKAIFTKGVTDFASLEPETKELLSAIAIPRPENLVVELSSAGSTITPSLGQSPKKGKLDWTLYKEKEGNVLAKFKVSYVNPASATNNKLNTLKIEANPITNTAEITFDCYENLFTKKNVIQAAGSLLAPSLTIGFLVAFIVRFRQLIGGFFRRFGALVSGVSSRVGAGVASVGKRLKAKKATPTPTPPRRRPPRSRRRDRRGRS